MQIALLVSYQKERFCFFLFRVFFFFTIYIATNKNLPAWWSRAMWDSVITHNRNATGKYSILLASGAAYTVGLRATGLQCLYSYQKTKVLNNATLWQAFYVTLNEHAAMTVSDVLKERNLNNEGTIRKRDKGKKIMKRKNKKRLKVKVVGWRWRPHVVRVNGGRIPSVNRWRTRADNISGDAPTETAAA